MTHGGVEDIAHGQATAAARIETYIAVGHNVRIVIIK